MCACGYVRARWSFSKNNEREYMRGVCPFFWLLLLLFWSGKYITRDGGYIGMRKKASSFGRWKNRNATIFYAVIITHEFFLSSLSQRFSL